MSYITKAQHRALIDIERERARKAEAEVEQLRTLLAEAGEELDDLAQCDWLHRKWPPLKGAAINGLLAKIATALAEVPTP